MKIIRNTTTDLIQYSFFDTDVVTMSANGMNGPNVRALDIKTGTHEIVENVTLPAHFYPGAYNYGIGSFPISNQPLLDDHLQEMKDDKIKQIDSQTSFDVLAILTEVKQRNYLARSSELLEKKVDANITAEEIIELDGIKALWEQIKTLRVDGNAKEVSVQAALTFDAVIAI